MTRELPQFSGLSEFYPYYLGEHRNGVCRSLHLLATTSVSCLALGVLAGANPWWLLLLPWLGYGPAWVGHFFFERNKPATFGHPLLAGFGDRLLPATFDFPVWSLLCDWLMTRDMLLGRVPVFGELPQSCIERFQIAPTDQGPSSV